MINSYPNNIFDEMKLLAKFSEESHIEGLKIHSDADEAIKTSAKSLFNKGMISQTDGGYLMLQNNKSIPVSVRKRAEVIEKLNTL